MSWLHSLPHGADVSTCIDYDELSLIVCQTANPLLQYGRRLLLISLTSPMFLLPRLTPKLRTRKLLLNTKEFLHTLPLNSSPREPRSQSNTRVDVPRLTSSISSMARLARTELLEVDLMPLQAPLRLLMPLSLSSLEDPVLLRLLLKLPRPLLISSREPNTSMPSTMLRSSTS